MSMTGEALDQVRIGELTDTVRRLRQTLATREDRIAELQTRINSNLDDAINAFLDLVERPTGKLKFTVPQSDAVNRAILGLFDVLGRNP